MDAFNDIPDKKVRKRLQEIQKRLEEYKKHRNDSYYPDKIEAVRELHEHAADDIEFLLNGLKPRRIALL